MLREDFVVVCYCMMRITSEIICLFTKSIRNLFLFFNSKKKILGTNLK